MEDGYEFFAKRQLITLFSAPQPGKKRAIESRTAPNFSTAPSQELVGSSVLRLNMLNMPNNNFLQISYFGRGSNRNMAMSPVQAITLPSLARENKETETIIT